MVLGAGLRRLIATFLERGRVELPPGEMMTFNEIKQLLGLDDILGLRERLEKK
jgi:hypothetical protein